MAALKSRVPGAIPGAIAVALMLTQGCVFEDTCVNGAERVNGEGPCVASGDVDAGAPDAGPRDAGDVVDGGPFDAGPDLDAGPTDAGADGGVDAGPPLTILDYTVGLAHMCAVDSERRLWCWGANAYGALATGDATPHSGPVQVDLGAAVLSVHGDALHLCAVTVEPSVYCWGGNEYGMIGDGNTGGGPVTTPFEPSTLSSTRRVFGGFANTCHLDLGGHVRCWGRNEDGQLGEGIVGAPRAMPGPALPDPTRSDDLEGVGTLAIGDKHICVLTGSFLYCTGQNSAGELGVEDLVDRAILTEVTSAASGEWSSVAASYAHTCAIKGGAVLCWGDNEHGVVSGEASPVVDRPTAVAGLPAMEFVEVVAGEGHACALTLEGAVYCWGSQEFGSLGDGVVSNDVAGPTLVTGVPAFARLESTYGRVNCGLSTDGAELWCWGQDSVVLLGEGIKPGAVSVFLNGNTTEPNPIRVSPLPR